MPHIYVYGPYCFYWLLRNLLQGNAAFKGRQWNKAVNYYNEAIKINGKNATYYCNRAAAYLELGWYDKLLICWHLFS